MFFRGILYYYSGMEKRFPSGALLRLTVGDITRVAAEAIVIAANSALRGGGGVDGAIHRAGGPAIMDELKEIREKSGGCPTGSAVATTAGELPARYVFHAVGPVYHGGAEKETELLSSCYRTCLQMADERGVSTISFPSISTGAYGYPVAAAAAVAIRTVSDYLREQKTSLKEVTFVLFAQSDYEQYERALAKSCSLPLE